MKTARLLPNKAFEKLLFLPSLENLPEDMWPEKQLEFKDILLMSAKEDAKSVQNVKEKLRIHLDELYRDDEEEKIKELSNEIDALLIQNDKNKFML